MDNDVMKIKNIQANIQVFRLNCEKNYCIDVTQRKQPKEVNTDDKLFSKLFKKTSNAINKNGYDNNVSNINKINSLIDKITSEPGVKILTTNDLRDLIDDVFKNDSFGLMKLELVMNILGDHSYEYKTNKETFIEISHLLNLYGDALNDTYKLVKEAYAKISINKASNLKKAAFIGSVLSIAILSGGTLGIVGGLSAAGVTSSLATVGAGVGMAEGLAILLPSALVAGLATIGTSYAIINSIDKSKLKKEFAKLTIDATTYSLVRTSIMLIHMKNKKDLAGGQEVYEELVEQYIDLKSDVDVRLFMKCEEIDDNKKKNSIFNNTDDFLKKRLFVD